MSDAFIVVMKVKSFEYLQICNVLERTLFCSPRLHLFDPKYCKTVILWNIISI